MKSGANFLEQNKINKAFAAGLSAKEISNSLGIKLAHIETYAPLTPQQKAAKTRAANKAANNGEDI